MKLFHVYTRPYYCACIRVLIITILVPRASREKDCFCVLPAGYGESLIYQLLPFVFDELQSEGKCSSCVIVVSPLNAIMEDQISKLPLITMRLYWDNIVQTQNWLEPQMPRLMHANCYLDMLNVSWTIPLGKNYWKMSDLKAEWGQLLTKHIL